MGRVRAKRIKDVCQCLVVQTPMDNMPKKTSAPMANVACKSKLHSVVWSSMYPCPGNWVAIRRVFVYYAQAAHALSLGIKCQHCKCRFMVESVLRWYVVHVRYKSIENITWPRNRRVANSSYFILWKGGYLRAGKVKKGETTYTYSRGERGLLNGEMYNHGVWRKVI